MNLSRKAASTAKGISLPPHCPESERLLLGAIPQWPEVLPSLCEKVMDTDFPLELPSVVQMLHVKHLQKAINRHFYTLLRMAFLIAIFTFKLPCSSKISLLLDKLDFKLDGLA